ncbi:M23 family metallopeptidase [Microbacter sp. GSS18]|nr:M23 family metallopeptidase [Microbacter sp. GSS18]
MRPRTISARRVPAHLRRAAALALILAGAASTGVPAAAASARAAPDAGTFAAVAWSWPVEAFRLERGYVAPAHRYGAGHRGVDVRPAPGSVVRAPADGIIAFSGRVGDRPLVTIRHGGGLVTTLEPVDAAVAPGERVRAGTPVGAVAVGGHADPGTLHVGIRLDDEYLNPLSLLGGVPRAVLLPCC